MLSLLLYAQLNQLLSQFILHDNSESRSKSTFCVLMGRHRLIASTQYFVEGNQNTPILSYIFHQLHFFLENGAYGPLIVQVN